MSNALPEQAQASQEQHPIDRAWEAGTAFPGTVINLMSVAAGGGGNVEAVNNYIFELWLKECGKPNPEFVRSNTMNRQLFIDNANRLCFARSPSTALGDREEGPAGNQLNVIAEFVGDRYKGGLMLLNGDGFAEFTATGFQDRMRDRARAIWGTEHVIIVPFEALTAARIDHATMKPIHITEDTDDVIHHDLGPPPGWQEGAFQTTGYADPAWIDRLWALDPLPAGSGPRHVTAGRRTPPTPTGTVPARDARRGDFDIVQDGVAWQLSWERYEGGPSATVRMFVWAATLDGEGDWGWQAVNVQSRERPDIPRFSWREDRHRLGASVFYATGFDERRHRWISAFDQHEPNPLYYLAQLPDKGEVKSYDDAINLLSPKIVHAAREQGKRVERQGDIFAIETELKTREVYKRAKQRVRRNVVLQGTQRVNMNPVLLPQGIEPLEWQEPSKGEVAEHVTCPACGNHKMRVGFGPKARQVLMIFNTSHTATEVVVCEGGVTFIRGSMFHDPQLEDPDRTPEHIARELEPKKWYLAVRNTVPRQGSPRRTRAQEQQEREALEQQTQAEAVAA